MLMNGSHGGPMGGTYGRTFAMGDSSMQVTDILRGVDRMGLSSAVIWHKPDGRPTLVAAFDDETEAQDFADGRNNEPRPALRMRGTFTAYDTRTGEALD